MSNPINRKAWGDKDVLWAMNAPNGYTCIGNVFTPPSAQPDVNAYS